MGNLLGKIEDDIYEYRSACIVFGVKFDEDDVYSKKATKLVAKMCSLGYGNRTHEYLNGLVRTGVLPIKGEI